MTKTFSKGGVKVCAAEVRLEGDDGKQKGVRVNKKKLHDEHACYILITCGLPTEDGKMNVEMTYEGDASLAAYLLENAQGFIDNEEDAFSI